MSRAILRAAAEGAGAGLEPPYGARDPENMGALIEALPRHVEVALARLAREPWHLPIRDPQLVAVGGMGGSAIAAELTAALWADTLPQPMLVVRGYRWPACVGPRALVVLSSNSGNTEEVLALESEARAEGLHRVAMASGGALVERCEDARVHCQHLPSGMPPRAALFHGWVPLTRLLFDLGWIPDPTPEWRATVAALDRANAALAPDAAESANPAKRLARELAGRTLHVVSASGAPAAVAVRWRQQFNENAKLPAHSAAVPELHHNEICGWQRSGPAQRNTSVVMLRDPDDSPEERARLDLTAEIVTRAGGRLHEVTTEGESRLTRMARLVQFGDWVSFYLALVTGADPTDISVLVEIKRRLSEARATGR